MSIRASRPQRTTRRPSRPTAVLAVIAVLVTMAAVVLTAHLATAGTRAAALEDKVSTRNSRITELTARADADRGTIAEQSARIRALELQVPPAIKDDATHVIRSNGRITLASNGDVIDLNSTELNWGGGGNYSFEADTLAYTEKGVGTQDIDVVKLKTGEANYTRCAVASGYATAKVVKPLTLESKQVCLRLSSGRYAVVRVERSSLESLDLAITVWELG